MPIIGRNPWSEAGAMGEGLGSSLAQALLQMPQQRAALAMQAQQQAAQQGFEGQRLAQERAAQQAQAGQFQQEQQRLSQQATAEQQSRQQEMQMHQVEYQKQLAIAQKELEAANTRNQQLARGSWKIAKDPASGQSVLFNATTGEVKPVPGEASPAPGLGASPAVKGTAQADATNLKTLGTMGTPTYQASNPTGYAMATNAIPQLMQRMGLLGQAQGGLGLGQTNAPVTAPGLGQPTNAPAMAPRKVLRYNPQTGQLE